MKALSIRQPWAYLIIHGLKDIENRDWETDYRGPLLIHASKAVDEDCFIGNEIYLDIFEPFGREVVDALPRLKRDYALGYIVGQANLIGVVEESESQWFCGTYGFVLKNTQAMGPIPYRGALRLFDIPESILEQPTQAAQTPEPECIIICQRSMPSKDCKTMWKVGDKVTTSIPYHEDVHGTVRQVKIEGLSQKVRVRNAVYAPLLNKHIVFDDKRWFNSKNLKPRYTIISELEEHDE